MSSLSSFKIETLLLTFSAEFSQNVVFGSSYTSPPVVTATAASNINIFVENLTSSGCTISSSETISGKVRVHIIG